MDAAGDCRRLSIRELQAIAGDGSRDPAGHDRGRSYPARESRGQDAANLLTRRKEAGDRRQGVTLPPSSYLLPPLILTVLACAPPFHAHRPARLDQPLAVARMLAARYPAESSMRYIPALTWSAALRLSALTGERRWAEKVRR